MKKYSDGVSEQVKIHISISLKTGNTVNDISSLQQ